MVTANPLRPLIVVAGPTASGKTSLSIRLAQAFSGEIISCDSVAVYRGMEIGSAKPTPEERRLAPHHLIDVAWPSEQVTAGDYSRMAREALDGISGRGRLPIVAGGTGLYLRALIDGLFPAPKARPELRERLRRHAADKGPEHLHRILTRLDKTAAAAIHANDVPKVIRAIEVSLASSEENSSRTPMTEQWQKGRDRLEGYRILRLGLNPPRALLYERINARAAAMFDRGLIEETSLLIERHGRECRALTTLGYAQAAAVLSGNLTREEAVAVAQQGHRNYAKRQMTWFRREPEMHWLAGVGAEEAVIREATKMVGDFLRS
ncbi:MAG: tRNA (adenosine(37)-N6)-dimethylallyltransferase MiaA [Edaphobacter sp.]|uniref:tRNA (adenosine(37)-N6)-dimethylallyltransferase MiaA n=1 Tax=Edaphobacter sp. TaxID=1934404 RepID=UPI0023961F9E|nr:tRNA (adenosine(37)-N6)-dimethylallyltransferase MiaA [Edaphobacter sp.]MDE1176422.1 tRNA (adenosine(37)-N6)-dimethylallyltransferase MiaA [Edaphobacter sp.]